MAIIDKNNKNWDNVSADEDQFIGLTLPLILDNGQQASTKTTIEAVKQNIYNLCSTETGERVMQPNLGVRLKRFLFEPYSEDLSSQVKDAIFESLNYWLPFISINSIDIKMSDTDRGEFKSILNIGINFSLPRVPNSGNSVQINIGE
jgi:phage baseplate assembly protein W